MYLLYMNNIFLSQFHRKDCIFITLCPIASVNKETDCPLFACCRWINLQKQNKNQKRTDSHSNLRWQTYGKTSSKTKQKLKWNKWNCLVSCVDVDVYNFDLFLLISGNVQEMIAIVRRPNVARLKCQFQLASLIMCDLVSRNISIFYTLMFLCCVFSKHPYLARFNQLKRSMGYWMLNATHNWETESRFISSVRGSNNALLRLPSYEI